MSCQLKDIGRLKTEALAGELALKHPWAEVRPLVQASWKQLRNPAVLRDIRPRW